MSNYGPKCYPNNQDMNRDFLSMRLYKFWRKEGNSYTIWEKEARKNLFIGQRKTLSISIKNIGSVIA